MLGKVELGNDPGHVGQVVDDPGDVGERHRFPGGFCCLHLETAGFELCPGLWEPRIGCYRAFEAEYGAEIVVALMIDLLGNEPSPTRPALGLLRAR
jgi:hypothetical protein